MDVGLVGLVRVSVKIRVRLKASAYGSRVGWTPAQRMMMMMMKG